MAINELNNEHVIDTDMHNYIYLFYTATLLHITQTISLKISMDVFSYKCILVNLEVLFK